MSSLKNKDIPRELLRNFLKLVLIFNVGVLVVSLGIILISFEKKWNLGTTLFLIGIADLVYGLYMYKYYKEKWKSKLK